MALLAWLAGLALLGLGKSAAAESEECLLLQAATQRDKARLDPVPASPEHGLELLTSQEWDQALTAAKLSNSTYVPTAEAEKEAKVLKEVEGHLEGKETEPFMLARLVQTPDGKCWVAFRGTDNDLGWQMNFAAAKQQTPVTKHKIYVPNSWLTAYKTLETGLKEAISTAYSEGDCHPSNMYLTGHSLGGVLASYAALMDLVGAEGHHAKCLITFGACRPWAVSTSQCRSLGQQVLPQCNWRFVRFQAAEDGKFDAALDIPSLGRKSWTTPLFTEWRHCAAHNIALYTDDESSAPAKCEMAGKSQEQCKFWSIGHGVSSIADMSGPRTGSRGAKQLDWELHSIPDYVKIIEANGARMAHT